MGQINYYLSSEFCADMLEALAIESVVVVNGLSGSGDTQDLTLCWMSICHFRSHSPGRG